MVAFARRITDPEDSSIVHVTEPAIDELKSILQQVGVLGQMCFRIRARGGQTEMTLDAPGNQDIVLEEENDTLLVMDTQTIKALADRILHFNQESSEFHWLRLVDITPPPSNE